MKLDEEATSLLESLYLFIDMVTSSQPGGHPITFTRNQLRVHARSHIVRLCHPDARTPEATVDARSDECVKGER